MSNKKLASNVIMLYVMTLGKYLLPLITLPYLTRVLTPDYYGVVSYMTSTMTYFQVFVDFGFLYSATREASLARDHRTRLGEILSETITAKLLLSLIGAVVLCAIIPFVEILRENVLLTVLYYLSVVVTAFLPDYIYRGLEQMHIVSIRFILARLVSTCLTFVLVRSPKDLLFVPFLTICGNLVAVAFSFLHLYKKAGIKLEKVGFKPIVSSLKASSVFFAATFATTAFGATTTFLMGFRQLSSITTAEIAYWGVAYQLVCTIEMLYDPIMSSLYPHMVKEKDYRLVKKILVLFMPLVLLGVVVCYFAAPLGIAIVGGAEYLDAVPIFRVLLPMLVFSFPAQLLGFPVLAPIKKEKWATVSIIAASAFHVLGLFFLIFIGRFSLLNIAILRSCTNAVLFISRVSIFCIISPKNKELGSLDG